MKKLFGFIIVLCLSFFAIRPLFVRGYFPMHDDTQVSRVIVMAKALKEGQFPVRWVSDLGYGYGYPIYNFYAPLPYYVGGLIHLMGVDSIVATKCMFGIGALLAAVSMYLLLFPTVGFVGSIAGAILFMYAPYHASQIYVRGAVGEYWAIAFVPLIIMGMIRAMKDKRIGVGCVIAGVGLSGTILSHTILGFLTTGLFGCVTVIYWCISIIGKKKRMRMVSVPIFILALGLGISAFFWLPAYMEMSATGVTSMIRSASTDFFDHFVCVGQLWNSPWGFAGSASGCVDGMSFKLGKIQILAAVTSLAAWVWLILRKRQQRGIRMSLMVIGIGISAVSVIGLLPVSEPIWRLVPFVPFIQYPWRLLAYTALGLAICGMFISTVSHRPIIRIGIAMCIIIATMYTDGKIFRPQYIYDASSSAFETQQDLRFRVSKISDEYLPQDLIKPKSANDIVQATIPETQTLIVRQIHESDTAYDADIISIIPQTVVIRKAYFPGWKYWLDGKEVHPTIAHGLPSVILSEGVTHMVMRFTDTPIRIIGNWISILSIIGVGIILFYDKKTKT